MFVLLGRLGALMLLASLITGCVSYNIKGTTKLFSVDEDHKKTSAGKLKLAQLSKYQKPPYPINVTFSFKDCGSYAQGRKPLREKICDPEVVRAILLSTGAYENASYVHYYNGNKSQGDYHLLLQPSWHSGLARTNFVEWLFYEMIFASMDIISLGLVPGLNAELTTSEEHRMNVELYKGNTKLKSFEFSFEIESFYWLLGTLVWGSDSVKKDKAHYTIHNYSLSNATEAILKDLQ